MPALAGRAVVAFDRGRGLAAFVDTDELLLLAGYIVIDAGLTLVSRERPDASLVGIVLTSLSLAVMWWLARAKRRTAIALGSRALEADAFQTTACW